MRSLPSSISGCRASEMVRAFLSLGAATPSGRDDNHSAKARLPISSPSDFRSAFSFLNWPLERSLSFTLLLRLGGMMHLPSFHLESNSIMQRTQVGNVKMCSLLP